MAVVFVDGVDGSGKTTLLTHLARTFAPGQATVALPLWRFLPALATPADFATWVTSTDAAHVATALLSGQAQRIQTIQSLRRHAGNGALMLVDRGPATVVASARAHLRTGIYTGHHPSIDVVKHAERLRDVVEQLNAETVCLSINLDVDGGYDRLWHRLTAEDRAHPGYLRYLQVFHHEFRLLTDGDPAWAGLHRVRLDATQPLDVNVSGALSAVREVVGSQVPE